MARYSAEFKEQVVRQLMAPDARSVAEVHRETGVSEPTLYAWRNQAREAGQAVAADPANPERWNAETKLAVVIETAGLNAQELGEYCRRKGLYAEQIERWRRAAVQGVAAQPERAQRQALAEARKRERRLAQELRRKDQALAEAAALLVLRKKAQALWGDGEEK